MTFVLNRILIALLCFSILFSFSYALNVYKRAEWLIYALDQPALILGICGFVHLAAIPIYMYLKQHSNKIEFSVNSVTLATVIYFFISYGIYTAS